MSINLFSTFPGFVDQELGRRRSRDELQNPKSPWMRMTSGFKQEGEDRRVLMGGDLSLNERVKFGFEDLYEETSETGEKYRPKPAITSVSVDEKLESFECSVEWTANSVGQLERLFPYFMNLGTTILVDWGWSNVPPGAVIDVSKESEFLKPFQNLTSSMDSSVESANSNVSPSRTSRFDHPKYEQLKEGRGRYSFVAGYVSNFSFSPEGNSQYSCMTEITSISKSLAKLSNQTQEFPRNEDEPVGKTVRKKKPLYDWIQQNLEDHLSEKSKERPKEIVRVDGGNELNRREDAVKGHTYYMSWREIEYIVNTKVGLTSQKSGIRNIKLNSAGSVISNFVSDSGGNPPIQLRSMDPFVCAVDVGGQSDLFRDFSSRSVSFTAGPPAGARPRSEAARSGYSDAMESWLKDGFSLQPDQQGFLYNLYIEYQLFVEAFEKNNKIFEALKYILNRCEEACFDIWDFGWVVDSNIVKVVDKNMTAENTVEDILGIENQEHVFKPNTRQTVLRDFNFDTGLDDLIKGQVVFQNRANLQQPKKQDREQPATNLRDDSTAQFFEKEFPGEDIVLGNGQKPNHSEIVEPKDEKQTHDSSKFSYESPLDVPRDESWVEYFSTGDDLDTDKMRKEVETTIETQGGTTKHLFYTAEGDGASDAKTFSRRLQGDKNKYSSVNSNNVVNINAQLTLAGIGGLSAHQSLDIKNIPNIFRNLGIFVIDSVSHSVSTDDWTTEIKTTFVVQNVISKE